MQKKCPLSWREYQVSQQAVKEAEDPLVWASDKQSDIAVVVMWEQLKKLIRALINTIQIFLLVIYGICAAWLMG
jgi:hypothetical protein